MDAPPTEQEKAKHVILANVDKHCFVIKSPPNKKPANIITNTVQGEQQTENPISFPFLPELV